MSIRVQLFAAILLVSGMAVAGFTSLSISRIQQQVDRIAFLAAKEDARILSIVSSKALADSRVRMPTLLRIIRQHGLFLGRDTATQMELYDGKGRLVLNSAVPVHVGTRQASVAGKTPPPPTPIEVQACLQGKCPEQFLSHPMPSSGKHGWVAAVAPLYRGIKGDELVGVIRVSKAGLALADVLAGLQTELLLTAAAAVVLSALMAWAIGKTLGAPLARLTAAARRIGEGHRRQPLPPPRGKEVRALTEAFTMMRGELEDRRRIETFTQDLSHELKNPIAAIAALVEAGELANSQEDRQQVAVFLAQITDTAHRLQRLVADLLALARADAGVLTKSAQVQLATLLSEIDNELRPIAKQRRVGIEVALESGLPPLRGDRQALHRAFTNLLCNAVEHAPADTAVQVQARISPSAGLLVSIRNPGALPKNLGPKIFERFVSRKPAGTGLGMAIAKSVIEAHGGELTLKKVGPPIVELAACLPTGPPA